MNMTERIQFVESRIASACMRSGRLRSEIEVIAVTKYVGVQAAGEVLQHKLSHIGENRWQDVQAKLEQFGSQGTWHFIGHLQTNKVKFVVGKFNYIHSLDRISLAHELERQAKQRQMQVHCFIQVNVSGEQSKYGLAAEELLSFVNKLSLCPHIKVVGLMTMAPHESNAEETRPVFKGLRHLRDELNQSGILAYHVPHLSMGMSNDFEVAVEEGATWLRLGSVLVGRDTSWES